MSERSGELSMGHLLSSTVKVSICRSGTSRYKSQVKTSYSTCIYTLSCALRHRTSSLNWGGFQRYHVCYSNRPHLLAEVGSGAVTCPMPLDLASRLRWTPVLSRVLWLWTSPPGWVRLWRCHVSYDSGPRLPAKLGSDAATCPAPGPRLPSEVGSGATTYTWLPVSRVPRA
jgi:hypothetical protein